MGQVLLKLLVGAITGLFVWMIFEPMAPKLASADWAAWELRFILALGMGIGLTVGALNGWIQGSRLHLLRGAALGLVFGGIGAPLGYQIGGAICTSMFGGAVFIDPQVTIATKTLARVIALTPIGIFLGAAIGASSLNLRRTLQGALGGLIGAGFGGLVFDTLGYLVGPASVALQGGGHGESVETGSVPRGLYAVLIGGLIALFIAIVDLIARSAWVRLVLGRNEGKEWPVDAQQTFIGRSERANIPLFGDPNVAPMHACIIRQPGGVYMLADGGSPAGTFLNQQRVQQAPLFHGAMIQVGSYSLQFLMKKGAAPVRGPEQFNQAYAIQGAQPAQPYVAATAYPGPSPGSLYGSAPTQAMPAPSGAFAAQQPTTAFPGPAGGFSLVAVDGPLAGQRYRIGALLELGRESTAVPMSYDANASRRHASISVSGNGVTVTDLGSTNGTFVNGQRVQTASAVPGDVIRIGATSFRVEPG